MLSNGKTYTTIAIYMRNLRHILNRAINCNILSRSRYPFGRDKEKYSIPQDNNKKKALTIVDIERLFTFTTEDDSEKLALAYWKFSYLCNGMNMADIANLKYEKIQGNGFTFYRQKTINTSKKKKEIDVYLLPEAISIIDEIGNKPKMKESYIFPIYTPDMSEIDKFKRLKQHIKATNKYIDRIAKRLGIEFKVTTYWARHSYSTILKRSGASIEFISEQLGHQTTKPTINYLDKFEDEQRAENAKVLTNFSKNKEKV